MIKRILSLCLIASLLFTSCGCMPTVQLNERAIVQAIGIDYQKDQYQLTVQIFSPMTEGGKNVGASSDNAKVITASGKTISEAIYNASLTQGKKLFIGHNRIIILGRDAAKIPLKEPLSYFLSNAVSRHNAKVVMADKTANEILTAKINQGMLPAEALAQIVENSEDAGIIEDVLLYQLLKSLDNKHESAILPIIKKSSPEKASSSQAGEGGGSNGQEGQSEQIDEVCSLELMGLAVVSKEKFSLELDLESASGAMLIRDKVKKTMVSVSTKTFRSAALQITTSKTKITPHFQDDQINFDIKISSMATISETFTRESLTPDKNALEELKDAVETEMKKRCELAFQKAVKEGGCDIFNFGNIVRQNESKLWLELVDHWDTEVKKATVAVSVDVNIDKVGLEF